MREKVLGSRRARHVPGYSSGAVLTTRREANGAEPPATRRILAAARDLVARGGAAQISMGSVASSAGVSKALVHYHFRDKASLIVALVEDVGRDAVARERAAMTHAQGGNALDAYWHWLAAELGRGDLRILVALADSDNDRVRAASRRIARERRAVAGEHIAQIFSRLALRARLPADLLAETAVAFIDGISAASALEPDRDPRPAFDALWLAILTLAE